MPIVALLEANKATKMPGLPWMTPRVDSYVVLSTHEDEIFQVGTDWGFITVLAFSLSVHGVYEIL